MAVLRVVDRRVGDRRRVIVSWIDGSKLTHEMDVSLPVDGIESEQVRWYLEDYAEFPAEPAPTMARDAEALLATVGRQLFERVFVGLGAVKVWAKAEDDLTAARVEIDTDPSDVPGVPWELLRDPESGQAVALRAAQFVRTHHETARAVRLPVATAEPLRVLLVICRPSGREDVPFRSVASRLVRSGVYRLAELKLTVLRPPTFAELAQVLRAAAEAGRPYHIVHFDGHGAFLDASLLADEPVAVSALTFGTVGRIREGRHGYLVFEDPAVTSNQRLVDGPTLAELLIETGVPVLVLNACRSAYAESPSAPDPTAGVHDRIRAYGSLAGEVADEGVPGVVAMRYNVYVDTAARFVEDLYGQLAAGRTLGAAVSAARKALAADPNRRIGATPVALQDWVVPTVYEPELDV